MNSIVADSAFFGVLISLLAYFLGDRLRRRFRLALFNPLLIAIALTIAALRLLNVQYESYAAGAKYLSWLLTPATVCLAIPLYERFMAHCRERGFTVEHGEFGAKMEVDSLNHGPVTILFDTDRP